MAYMCQGCSAEGEVWPGACPNCGSRAHVTLAPKKKDLIGQVVNGKYKIVSKLGQGGMGTVYKAVREDFGQTLALKTLNAEFSNEPEIVRRFLREVKTYGAVQHPNAVGLVDSGQTEDGALFIAMEFIAGKDLGRTIAERGRLPVAEAIDVCVQCCDVLGYAHEKGIIHRDLKPENIMLLRGLRSYHAKVLDFGIARLMDNTATQLTIQGTICGTPRYMSPEQARGKDIDVRSDIYSLGLVLFEMLCGRQAYTHASITDLLRAQVSEPVPHLFEMENGRDLPDALDAVIQRACAKNRDERYVSMGQFADALSKALPTMESMKPYGVTPAASAQDPAAAGRTFLGPGAANAAPITPSQANLTGPGPAPHVYAEVNPAGLSQVAIPASQVAKSMTPAPIFDSPTQLRQPRTVLEDRRAPSQIALEAERPVERAAPRSKAGLFIALGGVAALGVAAAVYLSRGETAPVVPPPVVAVAPAPAVVTPPAPPVVEPTRVPVPTPAPVNVQPAGATTQQAADARLMIQATYQNAMTTAVGAFASGNLDGARSSLDLIRPDAENAGQADALRKKVDEAATLLTRGRIALKGGDCGLAKPAFSRALKLAPGLTEAQAGLHACARSQVPDTAE
jgi:hypothetical protein